MEIVLLEVITDGKITFLFALEWAYLFKYPVW